MLNSILTKYTALTSGHLPAALDTCNKRVNFLAEKIVSISNINTALTIWEPNHNHNEREIGAPVDYDHFDYLKAIKIATPIIIGALLFYQYIRSTASKISYDKELLEAHLNGARIHEPKREDATFSAMYNFFKTQPRMSSRNVKRNLKELIKYLEGYIVKDPASVMKAKQTLGVILLSGDHAPISNFPPLLNYQSLLYKKIPMTGKMFVAQVWHFIKGYTPDGADGENEAVINERENCRVAFVSALAHGIEFENRICDYGICQHIVTGVLQGRLHGIDIDIEGVNIAQLLTFFLQRNEVKAITTKAGLMIEAKTLLSSMNNLSIENKQFFMSGIEDYANITY